MRIRVLWSKKEVLPLRSLTGILVKQVLELTFGATMAWVHLNFMLQSPRFLKKVDSVSQEVVEIGVLDMRWQVSSWKEVRSASFSLLFR